jgi:hypothetical protein
MLSHRQAGRLYASLLALSNKALRIQGRCTNTAKLKPDETSTGYVSAGMAVLWSSLSACTAAKTAAHGQTMRAQHSQAVASHRGVTQYNSCTPAGAPTALRPIGGCDPPPPTHKYMGSNSLSAAGNIESSRQPAIPSCTLRFALKHQRHAALRTPGQ